MIEISEKATLDDLHEAIQKAFGFYDDHLYSFFMDGKTLGTSKMEYTIRDSESEAQKKYGEAKFVGFTDEKKLKDFCLKLGQRFVYLYDFGANLDFEVRVEGIKDMAKIAEVFEITESHGKAPDQYDI